MSLYLLPRGSKRRPKTTATRNSNSIPRLMFGKSAKSNYNNKDNKSMRNMWQRLPGWSLCFQRLRDLISSLMKLPFGNTDQDSLETPQSSCCGIVQGARKRKSKKEKGRSSNKVPRSQRKINSPNIQIEQQKDKERSHWRGSRPASKNLSRIKRSQQFWRRGKRNIKNRWPRCSLTCSSRIRSYSNLTLHIH